MRGVGVRAASVAIAVKCALGASIALATEAPVGPGVLDEIVVTATKREESLQSVPLTIQALDNRALAQLDVHGFDDLSLLFPSVAFTNVAPGFNKVYIRGIATGLEGDHSGSQPSVGIYLDEQPITTVTGPLDLHVYDLARVEVLSGPQGTLFGAASEAGTIRLITNQPDATKFSAGYDLQANHVSHGDFGDVAEGFINIPLSPTAAVRLVAWSEHDAGFIDNARGTLTYPVPAPGGITIDNSSVAKKAYNTVDTVGGRGILRLALGDSWTVSPAMMGQRQRTRGSFGYDPSVGDLQVIHFEPESNVDSWYQAALTVNGSIANLDVVYTGALLKRNVDSHLDYTDYSVAYDAAYGQYFTDNAGNTINPTQAINNHSRYSMQTHELRLLTPKSAPVRFVGGLFYDSSKHDILQNYTVVGLAMATSVTGWPGTWWLTDQTRGDIDRAAFGELSADFGTHFVLTAGLREFNSSESLVGFYGFGKGNSFAPNGPGENATDPATGAPICNYAIPYNGAPCQNLSAGTSTSGSTYKLNLQYKIDESKMLYATWSKGFRPGGINRGGTQLVYQPDFLTNYELGWKTTWFGGGLRWNGAVFYDPWRNFQAPLPVQFGLSQIVNISQAVTKGIETDITWAVGAGWSVRASYAYTDAYLTKPFQGLTDQVLAPSGEQLPITPRSKGNVVVRYEHAGWGGQVFGQAGLEGQDRSWTDIRSVERQEIGPQPGYALVNLKAGWILPQRSLELFVNNVLNRRAELTRYSECDPGTCTRTYVVPARPLTVGIRYSERF